MGQPDSPAAADESLRPERLFGVAGKTVLITGGSRGIGRMMAQGFAAGGASVIIVSRSATDADSAAVTTSGDCMAIAADVGSPDGVEALLAALEDRGVESIDVLINNAGTTWADQLDEYPDSGFEKVVAVNLTAVFRLTRMLLPWLRRGATAEDPARVINIGSIDGLTVPALPIFAYSASKAGLHMLTRHLASGLVADGVTVNCIAPGYFPTKMTNTIFERGDIDAVVEEAIPLGRPGDTEDIAGAALYLSSRAGRYLTGVVLPVAGGITTIDTHGWLMDTQEPVQNGDRR